MYMYWEISYSMSANSIPAGMRCGRVYSPPQEVIMKDIDCCYLILHLLRTRTKTFILFNFLGYSPSSQKCKQTSGQLRYIFSSVSHLYNLTLSSKSI